MNHKIRIEAGLLKTERLVLVVHKIFSTVPRENRAKR